MKKKLYIFDWIAAIAAFAALGLAMYVLWLGCAWLVAHWFKPGI